MEKRHLMPPVTSGQDATPSRPIPVAIFALATCPIAITMTELVPTGLLPEIAQGFHISLADTGMLVSSYALVVVVSIPVLALFLARFPRKTLLLVAVACYTLGNLLSAYMPTYPLLLLVRGLTALAHGVIFSESYVLAAKLATPGKQSQALAIVFSGSTIATVLAIPAATWLGQILGWRVPFLLISAVGLLSWLSILLFVPTVSREQGMGQWWHDLRILVRLPVLLALLMTIFGSASVFALLTYIAPLLIQRSDFAPSWISGLLLIFGVGSLFGNIAGGRLSDWRLLPSLLGLEGVLIVTLLIVQLAASQPWLVVVTLFCWEGVAFALVAPLQMRVLTLAADASSLISAFNIAAFNLGNALGAFLGGRALESSLGLQAVPAMAITLAVVGLGFTVWSYLLDHRRKTGYTRMQQPAAIKGNLAEEEACP